MLDQGTAGPGPKVGIDSGGSGKAPTHQQWTFLRWCHRTKKAGGGRQQAQPESHGAGAPAHLPPREPSRRHYPQVPQHQGPGQGGRKCVQPSIRDLLVRHLPQGGTGTRNTRGPVQAAGLFCLAAGGSIHEEGGTSTSTGGQAVGQDALRQVTASHAASSSSVALQQRQQYPWHIPSFSLLNEGNHCYAIAFLYAIDIAMHRTCLHTDLPEVLRCLQGCQQARVFSHLGFLALGWREPERQHDVSEFIDFLHPKLLPRSFLGTWQGRRLIDNADMQRTVHNPTSLCIGLGAPPRHNPDVQTLIDHWYAQDFRQALMQLSPWLFLQLPRFRHQANRIVKAKQCYTLPDTVKVPVFRDCHTLAVQWQPYTTVALICHRGANPSSGHYYVVTPGQRGHLALDDDKKPTIVGSDNLKQVSREMYVIVIALSSTASHSVASEQVSPVSQQQVPSSFSSQHSRWPWLLSG